MDDRALSDLRADRARLLRELGDPEQVRSEREGIENAITELMRDHDRARDGLVERAIERRPAWLLQALGDPPDGARDRETWNEAARSVVGFRLDHDIVDHETPLGPEPPAGGECRRQWDQANAALERGQRRLGRESARRDRTPELGIG